MSIWNLAILFSLANFEVLVHKKQTELDVFLIYYSNKEAWFSLPLPWSMPLFTPTYFTYIDYSSLIFLYLIFHVTVICLSKYKYAYFTILLATPQWFPTLYKRKENYFGWHLKFFMTWFCFYLQLHCSLFLVIHHYSLPFYIKKWKYMKLILFSTYS